MIKPVEDFKDKSPEELEIEIDTKMKQIEELHQLLQMAAPEIYKGVNRILLGKNENQFVMLWQYVTNGALLAFVQNNNYLNMLDRLLRYAVSQELCDLAFFWLGIKSLEEVYRGYEKCHIELMKLEMVHMEREIMPLVNVMEEEELTIQFILFVMESYKFAAKEAILRYLLSAFEECGMKEEARVIAGYKSKV